MGRRTLILRSAFILLVGLLGFAVLGFFAELFLGTTGLELGTTAPSYETRLLSGEAVNSSALTGQVVLLDFGTTSCVSCIAAIPKLNRLHKTFTHAGLRVLTLNQDEEQEVRDFVVKRGVQYPVAVDDGRIRKAFGVYSYPTVVLIDRQGKIRAVHRKMVTEQKLTQEIQALLQSNDTT